MKGTCIRCGKPYRSVDDIHTCTPPKALVLADELYRYGTLNNPNAVADELRRLHEENEALREDVNRFLKSANNEREVRRQLERHNEALEAKDEALLRQAWDALDELMHSNSTKTARHKYLAVTDAIRARLSTGDNLSPTANLTKTS